MNLEELRSVQRAERQKDSLQHLRDSFYEDVADYVAQLKDERERAVEAADDPFASEDVRQLTDTIESTQEVANALYERRVGKVVKHASFAAADMATDEEGMTTEERELFDDLVARIRQNRETVMTTLEGTGGASAAGSGPVDDAVPEAGATGGQSSDVGRDRPADASDDLLVDALGNESAAGEAGSPPAPPDTPAAEETTPAGEAAETETTDGDRPPEGVVAASGDSSEATADGAAPTASAVGDESSADETTETDEAGTGLTRTTLRITADVGTVYGVDEREYDLARDDVVMLPTTNADPLVQKNAAERID
ncbi:hypothetical protein [Salinigranum halophilum]|uniref:hypothetical protein n=1 Tax=Salinigranum halophilum TaxID=2565931 RepID=UPI00115C99C9|nr:hypothetical protein [Salinigranum halophilum]